MDRRLLVIDDDSLFCDTVQLAAADLNVTVQSAHSAASGLALCDSAAFDVVLLDQKLPDAHGVDICKQILTANERTKVIFITAYPSFEHAVRAIKDGAFDYLAKPFDIAELKMMVTKALRTLDLEAIEQVDRYRNRQERTNTVLIGNSPAIEDVRHLVAIAASNRSPVLITGETGTGKTLVAKAIHFQSPLAKHSFLPVNCAAIPESLMEAELFGYEKGAFTGAVAATKGVFEMASGGTLFLDEIGELPVGLQAKLLGALDDGSIKRLGGQSVRPVNARVVAATNALLDEAIAAKQFREDLFYRLSVLRIHIAPLRDRTMDIPLLCNRFCNEIAPDQEIQLLPDEQAALAAYPWPGNVRELRNIIERAILLREGYHIRPSQLISPPPYGTHSPQGFPETSASFPDLKQMERAHIETALIRFDHNHTQTAKALGISRSTLIRKIKS